MAILYYITDRRQLSFTAGLATPEQALQEKVRAAFAAGVDYVQVREKDMEAGTLAALVEELVEIRAAHRQAQGHEQSRMAVQPGRSAASRLAVDEKEAESSLESQNSMPLARLLVNDRLDVARTCGADGVHLPADSLPIAAVRKFVGGEWIVGAACHSVEEVIQAAEAGADHVLVAPVFDTASKPGMKPMGLGRFTEICHRSPIPVFALGGVSLENARSCVDAGAKGLAGIRLFQQSPDLSSLCRQLRARL